MYLTRVNKRTLVWLAGGAVFLLILTLALIFFFNLFFKDSRAKIEGYIDAEDDVLPITEARVPRTQEEIISEYGQNMRQLLDAVQTMEGTVEEIFSRAEAGFFNIYVPNDLKDFHVQALLEIQKMIKNQEGFESKEAVKERLLSLLNNLLEENESLN